jgi:uncharacterized membrane protein
MLLGCILSQMNPVNNVVFYILMSVLVLYLNFYPGFKSYLVASSISAEFFVCFSSFHACYMVYSSHYSNNN